VIYLRKKLVFFIPSNFSAVGGSENVVFNYCMNANSNVDITIVETDFPNGVDKLKRDELKKRGIKFISISGYANKFIFLNHSRISQMFLWYVINPLLFGIIGKVKFRKLIEFLREVDVVYLTNNPYSMIIPKGPQVIGSTHNWFPKENGISKGIFTFLVGKRLLWKRIDQFHVFSHFKWFLTRFGLKGFALENGVNIQNDNELKDIDFVNNYIFYGRSEPCKGVLLVISAFKEIKKEHPEITLNIAGIGSLTPLLKKETEIDYKGYLDENALLDFRNSAHCFVYPSNCDQFPLVILEAISCGLFVLASDYLTGTFDEFSKIGILKYIKRDKDSVKKAMLFMYGKKLTSKLRNDAREILLKKYTWKKITDKLLETITNN